MPRMPHLPPCPNCGLEGGSYVRLEAVEMERFSFVEVPGFEIKCSCCGTRSFHETTKARVLAFWRRGAVITPFQQEQEDRIIAAITAEIAGEGFLGLPQEPTRQHGSAPKRPLLRLVGKIPDDDVPF